MAQSTKDSKRRKKKGSVDPAGVAHIKATFNNTHITLSDKFGNVVASAASDVYKRQVYSRNKWF